MVVVNNKKLIFLIILVFFISNKLYCSVILDYEAEQFIKKINSLILSVNDYKNDINIRIIKDDNINAYVNEEKVINISTGLISKAPSYVSLLGVLAHEIGHLEKHHIVKRKESIEKLQTLNTLGSLSLIASTFLSNNTEMIQALAVNQVGINNFYINFTKEQEKEADHYAIETINKLELPKEPLLILLNMLEEDSIRRGIEEEHKKFSTHPIYKDRYDIIEKKFTINQNHSFDKNLEKEFNFIKAKFLGHSLNDHKNLKKYLNQPYLNYAKSIIFSKNGDLENSLNLLNSLINSEKDNYYLLETKADILLSHGYKTEALKFYKKVLHKNPKNSYIQVRIFNNIDFNTHNIEEQNNIFKSNINLLFNFPNYKILNLKYKNLSIILNKNDWITFFTIKENKKNLSENEYLFKLNKISEETSDKYLSKLIKKHVNHNI